jgi:TATA-box binding protein (TBP) (component of TFIID and TFIIIB)
MANNQSKDVIFHHQALFVEITDEETVKLFQNKNLMSILSLLREEKHLTFREIEIRLDDKYRKEFEGKKDEYKSKSSKSIYRYLKDLENANLIVQSGKRVKSVTGKKIKSETLYSRTAKIFFPKSAMKPDFDKDKYCDSKFDQAIEIFLSRFLNKELKSSEALHDVLHNLEVAQVEHAISNIKNADEEFANIVSQLEWKHVNSFIKTIGLLALFCDDKDWSAELQSCFE